MQVSGIVIEIDGKKYAIDMEKAKELYTSLHSLFGADTIQYVPWYVDNTPYRPWWEYQPTTPIYPGTYCESGSSITVATTDESWATMFSVNSMELENE